jgi:hypothetical protein
MHYRNPLFLLATLILAHSSPASARVFTDLEGRSTEAEFAGMTGQDVLLRKSGVEMRWPMAKLSPADQDYVKEWQANPPVTPRLGVQIWKKDGISPAGTFAEEPVGPDGLPHIPGLHEVKKRDTFHYFAVDISNSNSTQANLLTLSYQIYVIPTSGTVIVETAAEVVPSIDPKKRASLATKAISTTRTKTTTLKLGTNVFGGLTTGQQSKRDSERFGGIWVRVYSHDGKMVGEAQDLAPEIERLKPTWVAPTHSQAPKLEGGLDGFDKFVQQVREKLGAIQDMLGKKPTLPVPGAGEKKPGLPLPPRFPK